MGKLELIKKEYKCSELTLSNGLKCTINTIIINTDNKVERLEGGSIFKEGEEVTMMPMNKNFTFSCTRMDNGQFRKNVNGWIDGDFATILDEIVRIIEEDIA
jgi:hypothetical protein